MTKIYLIRHAEAEGNIYRRLHGWFDSRLTHNGARQVEALRERFAAVPVDAVYASDLFRTRETAKAVYLPKGLPLHTDPRFREVNAGEWENRCFGDLERTEPEQLWRFLRDPEGWIAPGAETYEQYSARFLDGLRAAAAANPGRTIAVFSHGCVMSGSLHRLLGLEHNSSVCDNTGVSLLRWEAGRFTAEYLYDNSHLSPEISTRARQRWWREHGGAFNLWFRDPLPGDAVLCDPLWLPPRGLRTRVAVLGEKPVGCVCTGDRELSLLYLLPEYRHLRMGDQLLGEAVMDLRARGVDRLGVGVPAANVEALAFFSRHGGRILRTDDGYTVFGLEIGAPERAGEA